MRGFLAGALLCFWLLTAPTVHAQNPRLPLTEIEQIADQAISHLLGPDTLLSGMTVRERGIRFDTARTSAAFGVALTADTTIRLVTPVQPGTQALLTDCDQAVRRNCAALGQGVYVWLSPVDIAAGDATVRVRVHWAGRGTSTRSETARALQPGYLVGFSRDVYLQSDAREAWQFKAASNTARVY